MEQIIIELTPTNSTSQIFLSIAYMGLHILFYGSVFINKQYSVASSFMNAFKSNNRSVGKCEHFQTLKNESNYGRNYCQPYCTAQSMGRVVQGFLLLHSFKSVPEVCLVFLSNNLTIAQKLVLMYCFIDLVESFRI